jgi:ABC-2 type transport system permease protein
VELIRFAFYGKVSFIALAIVASCTVAFMAAAVYAYDPTRGFMARRGGPGNA